MRDLVTEGVNVAVECGMCDDGDSGMLMKECRANTVIVCVYKLVDKKKINMCVIFIFI